MSRYRSVATWSAGLLATAVAALLTASAVLPGSAAYLDVDGGVLQVFLLDGPDNVPGPPDGLPGGPPEQVPGPPEGIPSGPPEGIPSGPPDEVPSGPPEGVPTEPPAGSQDPSGQPSGAPDETDKVDGSGNPGNSDTSGEPSTAPSTAPEPPDPQQQQSEQGSQAEDAATPTSATASTPESEVRYENCAEVREAGVAPLDSDDPDYRPELDDDRDGRACEEGEGQS